jgi:hypothetical protein
MLHGQFQICPTWKKINVLDEIEKQNLYFIWKSLLYTFWDSHRALSCILNKNWLGGVELENLLTWHSIESSLTHYLKIKKSFDKKKKDLLKKRNKRSSKKKIKKKSSKKSF